SCHPCVALAGARRAGDPDPRTRFDRVGDAVSARIDNYQRRGAAALGLGAERRFFGGGDTAGQSDGTRLWLQRRADLRDGAICGRDGGRPGVGPGPPGTGGAAGHSLTPTRPAVVRAPSRLRQDGVWLRIRTMYERRDARRIPLATPSPFVVPPTGDRGRRSRLCRDTVARRVGLDEGRL